MKEALFSFGRIYTPWTEDSTDSDDPEEGISEACAGFLYVQILALHKLPRTFPIHPIVSNETTARVGMKKRKA
jgi:hypothetical protein